MKRAGKCVGKKSYWHKSKAIHVASKAYKYYGTEFGVYECPTCLDFHLTTKYCNLKHHHRAWLFALYREVEREFNILTRKDRRKRKRAQKPKGPATVPKKKQKDMLSQAEMQQVLANFNPTIYPQRQTLWQRIRGIIKGTRAGH